MIHKRFDKKLFEDNDLAARIHSASLLEKYGYKVKDHPDIYAQDLVATKGDKTFYVECEVKHAWKTNDFPFDSVQLPERKKKFCNSKTLFIIINSIKTKAIMFWSKDVLASPLVEVSNKYIQSGEKFFQIPLDATKEVTLDDSNIRCGEYGNEA